MMKMHDDEIAVDVSLVQRLINSTMPLMVAEQDQVNG